MYAGKFWLVWNPDGRNPTHMHMSRYEADNEAKRLAQTNAGQQFIVLKAVGGFEADVPPEPKVKQIDITKFELDNLPF